MSGWSFIKPNNITSAGIVSTVQKEQELVHAMQQIRCQLPSMYAMLEMSDGVIPDRHEVVSLWPSDWPSVGPCLWEECLKEPAGPEEALLATSHQPQQHWRSTGWLLTAKQKQLRKQSEQQQKHLQEQQGLVKESKWRVTICRLQTLAKGVPGMRPDRSWDWDCDWDEILCDELDS